MTPEAFITLWKNNPLTERAGAQAHFDDLCDLLGVPKPRDPEHYCFERGAQKTAGGQGWADVWKRGCFGWENKKPGRDLDAALKQLTDYTLNLENPPLLVVSDRVRIVIHTAFTGYPDEPREIRIEDLIDPQQREILRWVFTDPEKLKPGKSFKAITEEAAARFAALAEKMRSRGEDSQRVAHFLVQCLFCLFAEDERLLPENLFADLLKNAGGDVDKARKRLGTLFTAMRNPSGEYGDHDIPWFNGGLFQIIDLPPLQAADLAELHAAARDLDWRDIDPTIFGTLFERGLDPKTRAPLGAHYTDVETIGKLIDPVVTQPLLREWSAAKALIQAGVGKGEKTKAYKQARQAYQGFLLRLYEFRVLDAACGSGNFLYLALKALRDLEKRVRVEARDLGLQDPQVMLQTGPHNILGLEINDYTAELARVTVWIGDIQWCRRNGYPHATDPILQSLDGIQHRDALLAFPPLPPAGEGWGEGVKEAEWPQADVIVGNPPFLGDKMMRRELGDATVDTLRQTYAGRVPGGADLVCYWFEKARAHIAAGQCQMAGLVATNSIRGGANRKVLDRIAESTAIFTAWSDEPWVNEGAAVRVSLICFGRGEGSALLNGQPVAVIHADLTADIDVTKTLKLADNLGVSFQGVTPSASVNKKLREQLGLPHASFNLEGDEARRLLKEPATINAEPMATVVRPYLIADDITTRPLDRYIVNFVGRDEMAASLFEKPFQAILNVRMHRQHTDRFNDFRKYPWWLFGWPRPIMFAALKLLQRYISIPRISKHHICIWSNASVVPGDALIVVSRSDDTTFGILHSRFHELWSLRMGTSLEDRPRYTHTTTFETFPFPDGLTPADTREPASPTTEGPVLPVVSAARQPAAAAIAQAAFGLNRLREAWLNPPEWVDWVITPEEEQAGFPRRPVAKPGHESDLKKRTLTNLYNARPAWLSMAHEALDRAVAAAYGWDDYTATMPDEEILRRLLALNHERAAIGSAS
ncbi:MAG: class I SAM-dependent DNA methyltransferase [Methylococcus sp.]